MTDFPKKMLIFGCGNMGGAMLRGWIAAGIDPARFTVVDPVAKDLPGGVHHARSAGDAGARFDAALLGIKPQMLVELAGDVSARLAPGATLISILAGTTLDTLSVHFPDARITRLMPNLAAAIGKSPLALYAGGERYAEMESWMAPLGKPVWLTSENQMNAVTALAGSGPAFVYRFIDALQIAGAELGLPANVAASLALSTVEGAALLAAGSPEPPLELARRVTSPGGTTAAGLAVLDQDAALLRLVSETLRAARDRGDALARGE